MAVEPIVRLIITRTEVLKELEQIKFVIHTTAPENTDSGKAINLACAPDPSQFPQIHMELFLFFIMISTKPHLN